MSNETDSSEEIFAPILLRRRSRKIDQLEELESISEPRNASDDSPGVKHQLTDSNIAKTEKSNFEKPISAGKQSSGTLMEVKVAPERSFENKVIEVSWSNLVYAVKQNNPIFKRLTNRSNSNFEKYKIILNGVNGSFRSGELTAVMGPSGAGKSSLLECVCGKRSKGLSGDIHISGTDTIKVGFVEQFDHLLERLTVKESIIFASRLRNADRQYVDHETIALNLIEELGLEVCAQTHAIGCSGGQRKRLSIALELVSKANILVLDEPTSGLDSSATSQTIKAMVSLTKQKKPMAVVATIHQPSATIFNLFNNVIVMSNEGNCIYQGPPEQLVSTLSLVGLEMPNFYNPADYVIEVASGELGKQSLHSLTNYNKAFNKLKFSNSSYLESKPLKEAIERNKTNTSRPTFKHIWILFVRSLLTTIREPQLSILRVITIFPTAFLIGLIFNESVGQASGCPPSKPMLWKLNINDLMAKFNEDRLSLQENLALLFIVIMMSMFISMSSTILTFPLEMNVFRKEHQNSYYSVLAYYVAKVSSDLPFCFVISILFTTIVYFMTGQIFDSWSRFFYLIGIASLVTLSGQSIGMIFGALFMENPNAATFTSSIVVLPLFIFAGFFKKLSLLPSYLVPISYVSFLRYALSAVLITVFGVGRCSYEHRLVETALDLTNLTRPQWLKTMSIIFEFQSISSDSEPDQKERDPEESLMMMFGGKNTVGNNSEKSLLLAQFEIEDSNESLWFEIRLLILFVSVMHIMIYLILVWKVGRKA